PNSVIAFAAGAPGSIYTLNLNESGPMTCQKGAFLCAQDSVNLKTVLTKKLSAGFFGGEGFILQEISGSGIAFLEIDGDLVERELAPGEVLKVDTGNVVAFDSSMSYEIEMVKGAKNIIFGGEGLFLTKLTGPGKVVLQTQSIAEFALRIAPYIPMKSN
ncbi:MAG: AIM24 family protein, partial [Anaerotignum sp.]|nr:AIM24 family protein [Anaerotignum sp.]